MGMWSGGQSISIFISHDKARWSIPAREVNRSNAPVMLISLYHPLLDFQKGLLGVEITRPATGPTSRPNDVGPPLTQADLATAAEERPCFQPFNPMLSPYVTIPPGNQTTFCWSSSQPRGIQLSRYPYQHPFMVLNQNPSTGPSPSSWSYFVPQGDVQVIRLFFSAVPKTNDLPSSSSLKLSINR